MKKVIVDWEAMSIRLNPEGNEWYYDIDLYMCTTSSDVLDWVLHIMEKRWGNPMVIESFIRTLDDACHQNTNHGLRYWTCEKREKIPWSKS